MPLQFFLPWKIALFEACSTVTGFALWNSDRLRQLW
ncbi:hypothetical protein P3T16_004900 [Paraburkholderia sp. GAS42]